MAASGAIKHIRNYASAGALAAFAGIITFPILTRSLSIEEYGILGLITASATMIIALGKLGMQHAVIRFFAQVKNGNIHYTNGQLNSTVSLVFLTLATVVTVLWLLAGFLVLPGVMQTENISSLFLAASGIVFVRLLGSGVMNFLRAQQRSAVVGATQVLNRYLYLSFVLLLLLIGNVSPYLVIFCMLLAEIIAVSFAAKRYWPDFTFSGKEFTAPLAKAMMIYGMPLMMIESLSLFMRLSDRYIIEAILGVNELGQYSASYNLAAYADLIVVAALLNAVKPYYMQLWESEGAKPTKNFLSNGIHFYFVLGIPFITVFSLVSPHLLNFLASPKYAPGTIIIPFVVFSFLLEGSMMFLGAGLYIKKNTKVLMIWGLIATLLNVALNILVIPVHGILGAALVTIISYLVFMLGVSISAFRYVSFKISTTVPLLSCALSLLVYAVLFRIDVGYDFGNILVKGTLGSILLVAGIVLVDAQSRSWVLNKIRPAAPEVS